MSIAQMLRFIELTRDGDDTIPDRLVLLAEHDRRIDEQIARLRANQQQIQAKIRHYRSEIQLDRGAPDGATVEDARTPQPVPASADGDE